MDEGSTDITNAGTGASIPVYAAKTKEAGDDAKREFRCEKHGYSIIYKSDT